MRIKSILPAFIALLISFSGHSQIENVDINQLIEDSQINSGDQGEIKMNWWIPTEFWEVTFANEPSLPKEEVDKFIEILKPYTIFAVIDAEVGAFGGVTYTPLSELKKSIVMVDQNGEEHKPMESYELNSDMRNFLSMFQPILVNMIGQMGENMHFFVFSDVDDKGNRVVDPNKDGNVTVKVVEEVYEWKTPLGSLLPPKKCPKDNELMNGAWKYCPYHGTELVEQK